MKIPGYLHFNVSLRMDSTSQHLFQQTLYDARAQTLGVLSTLAHRVLPFKPCPGLRKLLKQERRLLQSAVALPKVTVRRKTWLTRLETCRVHSQALRDSLRASCQNLPADSHCGKSFTVQLFLFDGQAQNGSDSSSQLTCPSISSPCPASTTSQTPVAMPFHSCHGGFCRVCLISGLNNETPHIGLCSTSPAPGCVTLSFSFLLLQKFSRIILNWPRRRSLLWKPVSALLLSLTTPA